MFIRSLKVRSSNGTVHEYVRIVASVLENGRTKQKVIANLGRRDTLASILLLLNRFLTGEEEPQKLARQLRHEVPHHEHRPPGRGLEDFQRDVLITQTHASRAGQPGA